MQERQTRPTAGITQNSATTRPVSILACGGQLPLELARILHRDGRPTNIVAIAGMANADYSGFHVRTVEIGRVAALLRELRAGGARDLLIAGHASRPDLRGLRQIDSGLIVHLPTILKLMRGGDDHVLRRVAGFFEANGLVVRGIAEVAPELLTPAGNLTHVEPPYGALELATSGLSMIHALGKFDVGQAVVLETGGVIALEGAEGTDGLIARLPPPAANDVGKAAPPRILVKAAKPQQDLRLDLPTIGPDTIKRSVSAGIRLIALEASRSLIVARQETIDLASQSGIAIVGLPSPAHLIGGPASAKIAQPPVELCRSSRVSPSPAMMRDAVKGLALLENLEFCRTATAALVARENILAVNIGETANEFALRTEKLAQWGDRRGKKKRNKTLIVRSIGDCSELIGAIDASAIAGIVVASVSHDAAGLDCLVAAADRRGLFVLSPA